MLREFYEITEKYSKNQGSGDNVETFYNKYNSLVYKKNNIAAQHCMVSNRRQRE